VPGLVGVVQIACSELHSCALLRDGTVRCWGENRGGQLGDGSHVTRGTPVAVAGLRRAVQIAVGFRRSCAVLRGGGLRCWGSLGEGSVPAASDAPVVVLAGVAQVGLGQDHSCARMRDGTVQCWGSRRVGELGDGLSIERSYPRLRRHERIGGGVVADPMFRPTPEPVHGLRDVTDLAVGDYHSCALTGAGTVYCWGRNDDGQIGDGTQVDASLPVSPSWPAVAGA
jgi:alpha-tubulin suppressor-like RCC1 family protein